MILFSYVPESENTGLLVKTADDSPVYSIDFSAGLGAGVSISSQTVSGVDSVNVASTTIVNGGISVLSPIATVQLKTGGSGGTGPAANGARFRVRTTVTCSDGRVLVYDTFIQVQDPAYNPD